MKTYIGTKIIQAEPMDRRAFHFSIRQFSTGWPDDAENEPGYKVLYPDGYVSWCPKAVFEAAYREVTPEEKSLLI